MFYMLEEIPKPLGSKTENVEINTQAFASKSNNCFYGSLRLIYGEGGHKQVLGMTKIFMVTFLCFTQAHEKN